jgi:hypothetical protein
MRASIIATVVAFVFFFWADDSKNLSLLLMNFSL